MNSELEFEVLILTYDCYELKIWWDDIPAKCVIGNFGATNITNIAKVTLINSFLRTGNCNRKIIIYIIKFDLNHRKGVIYGLFITWIYNLNFSLNL
jgi:hypothetical protein